MMKITKRVWIRGRVQGVGFRYFTRKNAEQTGVTGWVRNVPDGRVEAVFQGSMEQVEEMISRVAKGPPHGKVTDIETEEISAQEFRVFEVRY